MDMSLVKQQPVLFECMFMMIGYYPVIMTGDAEAQLMAALRP